MLKHNGKSYQLEVVHVVGTPATVQAMARRQLGFVKAPLDVQRYTDLKLV